MRACLLLVVVTACGGGQGPTAQPARAPIAPPGASNAQPVEDCGCDDKSRDHSLGLPAIVEAWPSVRIVGTAGTHKGMTVDMAKRVLTRPDAQKDAERRARIDKALSALDANDPKAQAEARYVRERLPD